MTTSVAAVGAGDDALAGAGGGVVFATELGAFDDGEVTAAFGCAGGGWAALLVDEEFEAGDEMIELG